MGSSTPVLALESLAAAAFLALAVIGFKESLWLTAAALAGTRNLRLLSSPVDSESGVPAWWPGFCMSFDVLAGGLLAVLLMRRSGFASPIKHYTPQE
jgi:hypothetical protein